MRVLHRVFIADPADPEYPRAPTTSLIEFTVVDREGTAGGWGTDADAGVVLGDPETHEAIDIGSMGADGDLRAAHRHKAALLQLPAFYIERDGAQGVVAACRELATALDNGGVLAVQLDDDDELLYYDFASSPSVTTLFGQPQAFLAVGALKFVETQVVEFFCENPYPRRAPVAIGPFTVSNDLDGRHFTLENPGSRPGDLELATTPTSGNLVGLYYALRNHGPLDDLAGFITFYGGALSRGGSPGPTFYNDTALSADSEGSGGESALIDFTNEPTWARRVRDPRRATRAAASEGRYQAWVRVKLAGGTIGTSRHKLKLRYGFANGDLTSEANRTIEIDWRGIDNRNYVEIPLGRVVVPKGCTALNLDLWAKRRSGDENLRVDGFILTPADLQSAWVTSPGFRLGAWGRMTWDPDEFGGTGALKRGAWRLNEDGETARNEPNGGVKLPAGVYEAHVELTIREPDNEDDQVDEGTVKVIRNRLSDNETKKTRTFRSKENQLWTRREVVVPFTVSSIEAGNEDRFTVEVEQTASSDTKRYINVTSIELRFIEAITSSQPAVLDSIERRAYARDGSEEGLPLFPLVHENQPLLAPVGDTVVVLSLLDRVGDPGYRDADERLPLAKSELGRTVTVTGWLTPREWPL